MQSRHVINNRRVTNFFVFFLSINLSMSCSFLFCFYTTVLNIYIYTKNFWKLELKFILNRLNKCRTTGRENQRCSAEFAKLGECDKISVLCAS